MQSPSFQYLYLLMSPNVTVTFSIHDASLSSTSAFVKRDRCDAENLRKRTETERTELKAVKVSQKIAVTSITGLKSHYPPGNHYASHFYKVLHVYPGPNHTLTTGADLSLAGHSGNNLSVRSSAPVVGRWFGPANRTFL